MDRESKIFIAGRSGLAGAAIERKFRSEGFHNITGLRSAELDLRSQELTERYFEKERPDYVVLAAAKTEGIMSSSRAPAEFLYDNLSIQSNVIEFSRKYGVKKLLFLASSCIYPGLSPQPMKEEYLMGGRLDPSNEGYAVAKIAGVKMCQMYNRQYGTDFISAVPCNIYGYGDDFDPGRSHVAAALIRKVYAAKAAGAPKVTLWGTGAARRELIFADDLADACFFLFQKHCGDDIYNIGTGTDSAVRELAEMVMDIAGYHAEIEFDKSRPDGMPRMALDVSRLAEAGWTSGISLREGLEKTCRYFQDEVLPVIEGNGGWKK